MGATAMLDKRTAFPQPTGEVRIIPSLLAADFGRLAETVQELESYGALWISIDVMDGHFVPNLSFGPDHVKWLRARTKMALDAHLMVTEPGRFIEPFAKAGADLIIVHAEACADPRPVIDSIHAAGAAAGLAVKPATPASAIVPHLSRIELALVMTVEPGFGGQSFRADMLPKLRELRKAIDASGKKVWLMADGGVKLDTVEQAAAAGADALVSGTGVMHGSKPPREMFRILSEKAQEAYSNGRSH